MTPDEIKNAIKVWTSKLNDATLSAAQHEQARRMIDELKGKGITGRVKALEDRVKLLELIITGVEPVPAPPAPKAKKPRKAKSAPKPAPEPPAPKPAPKPSAPPKGYSKRNMRAAGDGGSPPPDWLNDGPIDLPEEPKK